MGIAKAGHKAVSDLVAAMMPGVRYSVREVSGLLGTGESTASLLLRRAVLDGAVRQSGWGTTGEFWVLATPAQDLWDACARLPPEKRTLIRRLATLDVSDRALITALAVVQMMRFDRYGALPFWSVSQVTGLPTRAVRQAVDELLAAGAIEHQTFQRPVAIVNHYRLLMPGEVNSSGAPQ